jgi:hypothetical protein
LLDNQTLAQVGVKAGDILRLQPEITAGAKTAKNVSHRWAQMHTDKMHGN